MQTTIAEQTDHVCLYKCRVELKCIHFTEVCNGAKDCMVGDDELLCSLKDVTCPGSCECLTFVIRCTNGINDHLSCHSCPYRIVTILKAYSLKHLFEKECCAPFPNAVSLTLTHMNLSIVCDTDLLPVTTNMFDGSFNTLNHLQQRCFQSAPKLQIIKVNNNNISKIHSAAFHPLDCLMLLNLSANLLLSFDDQIMLPSKISFLSINQILLEGTRREYFENMAFKMIESDQFAISCLMSSSTIHIFSTNFPWHAQCQGIFLTDGFREVTNFVVAFITFILSASIILEQNGFNNMPKKNSGVFSLLTTAINFGAFAHPVPLVVLALANNIYVSIPGLDREWRQSIVCFSTFALFTLYCFLTQSLVCLTGYCRLSVVEFPLDSKFLKKSHVQKCLSLVFSSVVTLMILCTMFQFYFFQLTPTALCCPFIDPADSSLVTLSASWLLLATNSTVLVCTCLFYVKLVTELKNSEKSVKHSLLKERNHTSVSVQLVTLYLGNLLSFPSSLIFTISLHMEEYVLLIPMFALVLLVPLNSVVLPVFSLKTGVTKLKDKLVKKSSIKTDT